MFVNDRIIYLQMQKTGCSHIARMLSETVGGQAKEKHSKLTEPRDGRVILGSVRNPWEWYVSLWAFGCLKTGGVHQRLTVDRRTRIQRTIWKITRNLGIAPRHLRKLGVKTQFRPVFLRWRHLYSDPRNVDFFREWLERLLSEDGKRELGKVYPESGLHRFAGLMTYRFVSLYTDYESWLRASARIETLKDLESFWDEHCIIDKLIRNESLEDDLVRAFEDIYGDIDTGLIVRSERTNRSAHHDWKSYYDERTARLVRDQDDFIVRRYGYRGPFEAP